MHRRSRLGALTCLALVLTGCTSAIKVAPYEGADDGSCDFVADAWPARVAGQEPVVTAVESTSVAAWGEPAIIARCGGPFPARPPISASISTALTGSRRNLRTACSSRPTAVALP
ncbi:hypothetical protein [Ornithinimicrobium sp. INDO-MA30-4]|uniref:hypothetical protein n=1 Tax=Ornithinimicrobium sp. INDO-MA30-4 TaxID=2908651 RepID=UPI001F18BBFE|nr:hypothetical protein [Ornithinimicrobium sp. INDO-MA30-4]UJH70791.1 hypothetical protein L0A91_01780 [Ornithinimicrobium sp. INDO-MA30-4]